MVFVRLMRLLAPVLAAYCFLLLGRVLVRRLFMPGRRPQRHVHGKHRKFVKSSVLEEPKDGGDESV
jgi:hypothetical protein